MTALARRRPRAAPTLETVADMGAQPWRAVVEDAADPDRPNATIRRARRYDPLRRMELDPALFVAAERFRDCWELADGAREGVGNARLEPWQRCHYAARVADARQEVRDCLNGLSEPLLGAFYGAVVRYRRLRDMDRELGARDGTSAARVVAALEVLREWQEGRG